MTAQRRPLRLASLSWSDVKTAASFFSRFPRVSKKPETCSFKGTVVNISSYVTHPGNFLVAQPCVLIGFLQWAAPQLDVQSFRITTEYFRLEHFSLVCRAC
jgi:hypothetical protein